MDIILVPAEDKKGFSERTAKLAKAISAVLGGSLKAFGPKGSLSASILSTITELVIKNYAKSPQKIGNKAWHFTITVYLNALGSMAVSLDPADWKEAEISATISALLNRFYSIAESNDVILRYEHFYSPSHNQLFRDAVNKVPQRFSDGRSEEDVSKLRVKFVDAILAAFLDLEKSNYDQYRDVIELLKSPTKTDDQNRNAHKRHEKFLIKAFTQDAIFGQEKTGIALSDLYVRQRCTWRRKTPSSEMECEGDEQISSNKDAFDHDPFSDFNEYQLYLDDLHTVVDSWLSKGKKNDTIRFVAGGPGSGKSTFAKALSVEAIDKGDYDVLFVPLQRIEAVGSFESRIAHLFKTRTELGFDRAESPLIWLGQGSIEGAPPQRPLLLICDGLDEISSPGSKEAINVTTDFIQTLWTWLTNRNSGGIYVKAIVLGRDIAAEEAFKKLSLDSEYLLRVSGLLPLSPLGPDYYANDIIAPQEVEFLANLDQRKAYWANWCSANHIVNAKLPAPLSNDSGEDSAIKELTAEPLLLYLLIWTEYIGDRWAEAAENRNVVYREIFKRIYRRDWGDDRASRSQVSNREIGGHTHTEEISFKEFKLLQESLGLGAWANGARIVSSDDFVSSARRFLDQETFEDLGVAVTMDLKTVAMQSYARGSSDKSGGYEFVHKSLGEYLIACALVTACINSVTKLTQRVSASRLESVGQYLAGVCGAGVLTSEIEHFFRDEIRLRFDKSQCAKSNDRIIALLDWVLQEGIPVHRTENVSRRFIDLEVQERRVTDVIWSFSQHIFGIGYNYGDSIPTPETQCGPVQLKFPSEVSFTSIFVKLTERSHVKETNRIPSFSYLNLVNQGLTDLGFGSVIFHSMEDSASPTPSEWENIVFVGCNLTGAKFYASSLWNAKITHSLLLDANLVGARLDDSEITCCDFTGAQMNSASLIDARFNNCRFVEVDFDQCDMRGAVFSQCYFENIVIDRPNVSSDVRHRKSRRKADFRDAEFISCTFVNCDLSKAMQEGCLFSDPHPVSDTLMPSSA